MPPSNNNAYRGSQQATNTARQVVSDTISDDSPLVSRKQHESSHQHCEFDVSTKWTQVGSCHKKLESCCCCNKRTSPCGCSGLGSRSRSRTQVETQEGEKGKAGK